MMLRSLSLALQEIHYKASFPHIPSFLPSSFPFSGGEKKGLPNANWNLHLKDQISLVFSPSYFLGTCHILIKDLLLFGGPSQRFHLKFFPSLFHPAVSLTKKGNCQGEHVRFLTESTVCVYFKTHKRAPELSRGIPRFPGLLFQGLSPKFTSQCQEFGGFFCDLE